MFWGTASSSLHDEGAAPTADWYRWEQSGRAPRSGVGNGLRTNPADHFEAIASIGVSHHLLSLEWARLEPDAGQWSNDEAEQYRSMLAAARAAGLEPWVCLQHVSLPGWFIDEGSFPDDQARGYFWPRFVDRCAQTFGDLVGGWIPIWEPLSWAWNGYLAAVAPPGRQDPDGFGAALRGAHLAHRDAWRELRGGAAPVVTAHPLGPVQAADQTVPAAQWRRRLDAMMWSTPTSAQRDGVLTIPGRADEVVADLAASCDLFGFTYRGGLAVDGDGKLRPYPGTERVDQTGHTPWPAGLGETVRRVGEELGDGELVIAAFGVGTDDDEWRADVISAVGDVVHEAIGDGIAVRGAFHWTAVDGYEPGTGFTVPFGVLDRDHQPRRSASVLGALNLR